MILYGLFNFFTGVSEWLVGLLPGWSFPTGDLTSPMVNGLPTSDLFSSIAALNAFLPVEELLRIASFSGLYVSVMLLVKAIFKVVSLIPTIGAGG
jgi:hypothetical protein